MYVISNSNIWYSVKMCENLLKSVLIGDIKTETLLKWLKNADFKDENDEDILSHNCSQGEFILFFLNYLHDATAGVLHTYSTQMTPNRIKTPRRVESFSSKSNNHNDSKKSNTRRVSLFPDKQKHNTSTNQCLGVNILDNESLNHSGHSTSTPRPNKSRTSLDRSFPNPFENPTMSPISPVYHNHRSITPKTSSRSESTNFCLGDFIIKKSLTKQKKTKLQNISKDSDNSFNKSSDNLFIENCRNFSNIENSFESNTSKSISLISVKSRRINPTNLTTLSQDGSLGSKRITPNNTNNSFSFQKLPETDVSVENPRDILREERLKILSRSKTTDNTNSISEIKPLRGTPRSTSICIVQPELESVTNKAQLDILAQIYSLLIDLNLVLNTLSELYFLITLILIQVDKYKNTKEIEELRATLKNSLTDLTNDVFFNIEGLFNNVHNCVYFAANVLARQFHLLSALDRASLKLLQENARLQTFAPDLAKQLVVYHGKKIEKKTEIYSTGGGGENVSFISDTDNRENFPNDSSFHTFRKQRDLFYELLRIWETNHMQSDWNFNSMLAFKIRNLISMHYEPVNYMHLARLFKNQLLAECSQETEATLLPSCLNAFSNINAEKLSRLTNRLVSKKSTGGPSPEPSFPGKQEFYKEFIIVCESSKFHRHLIDCLVAEILVLDDVTQWPLDADETNSAVDFSIKRLYLKTLKSLKILAKFLGLLESYPHKTESIPSHQILTTQISIRQHFIPTINIIQNLNEALLKGTLILTIPWVADYLAMLDHTTLRLPYFTQFIETLFEIHYNSKHYFKYTKNIEQILMIKLCLGWLFERPNFPLESYQTWITKKYQHDIVPFSNLVSNGCNSLSIDYIDIVDETVLFSCCPYIIEIRNCLSSDPNSNYNNSGPVKYIRPISTVGENSDITKKRLQKQLEDAFFHSQPTSTRKIIDLIIDRVSSACVKYICYNIVPEAKQKYLNVFQKHLEHISSLSSEEIKEQISVCCLKQAREYSETCFKEFKLSSMEEIKRNTRFRCENSLKALLPDDVHQIARSTCVSIAIEQSMQKIQQWYIGHVNPGIFLKDFVTEMENMKHNAGQNSKKITYKLPSKGKNIDHNPDASSPVVILINIREQMFKIHEKPDEVELDDLIKIIEEASITCQKRCDLNQVAQFTSCRLFFDMFFMLASKRPDIATETNLIECYVQFWNKYLHKSEKENFFERVFCPRNACMFENSSNPKLTWLSCEKLLIELFNKQLLKTEQFEKQTIAMFRYEWESNTIKHFSQCLQNVVDDYVAKNGAQENFTFILSWIAEYCNDDEFF